MVCRKAYLLSPPTITEVTEEDCGEWDVRRKRWVKWKQPLLTPHYEVSYTYDYGFCCGVDDTTDSYATREAAEAAVQEIMDGKVDWLIVDEDFMSDN